MTPHLAPRTIREWLDLIPFDRARKEAIEDYDYHPVGDGRLFDALSKALFFLYREEIIKHHDIYWRNVLVAIKRMEQSVKLKEHEPPMMGMAY